MLDKARGEHLDLDALARNGDDPQARLDLIIWLEARPESELHDRLLIDALKERAPSRLGRDWFENVPKPLRRLLAHRKLTKAFLTVSLLAALGLLAPMSRSVDEQTADTVTVTREKLAPAPANVTPTVLSHPTSTRPTITAPTSVPTASATPFPAPMPIYRDLPNGAIKVVSVYFEWDKSDITPEAAGILDGFVSSDKNRDGTAVPKVLIRCVSDTEFAAGVQFRLSARRCVSVQGYLTARGIAASRIEQLPAGSALSNLPPGTREVTERRADLYLEYNPSTSAPASSVTDPAARPTKGISRVQISDTPRAKGVLTQEFIARQTRGNSILDTINSRPGVSLQNNDPFSAFGGTLRPRGFVPLPGADPNALGPALPGDTAALDHQSDTLYDAKEYAGAMKLNTETCQRGSYRGCYWTGYLYESGKGVTVNLDLAIEWYRKSCTLGYQQGCAAAKKLEARSPATQ